MHDRLIASKVLLLAVALATTAFAQPPANRVLQPARSSDGLPLADERARIIEWAQRAETYRRAVEDDNEQAFVDCALATMYAQGRSQARALNAALRVAKSDAEAATHLDHVSAKIAEHFGDDPANELLRAIDNAKRRDACVRWVMMEQGAKGRINAARQTAKLATTIEGRNDAWHLFAALATLSRRFNTARAAVREMEAYDDKSRERQKGAREMIERRAKEPKEEPPTADALWKMAEASPSAHAWHKAAEAYAKRQDDAKCRTALAHAEPLVDKIDIEAIRVTQLTLLAHAYLQIGDVEEALRVAQLAVDLLAAREPPPDDPIAQVGAAVEDFLTIGAASPILIHVIARCGDLDLAMELAAPNLQWLAVGGGCTSAERQAELLERLPDLDTDCERALACIGVAQGLIEQHRQR